jgi:hypothetical protein
VSTEPPPTANGSGPTALGRSLLLLLLLLLPLLLLLLLAVAAPPPKECTLSAALRSWAEKAAPLA